MIAIATGGIFSAGATTFDRLSSSDPEVDEAAALIETARTSPDSTDPIRNNKNIPGFQASESSAQDNNQAGRALNAFHIAFRMFDGRPFFVEVRP